MQRDILNWQKCMKYFNMRQITFSVLLSVAALSPGYANGALTGAARVVDGDTVVIGQQAIRLDGIDAPESGQRCKKASGQSYRCGVVAEKALIAMIRGGIVTCKGDEKDAYQRIIGQCYSGGVNLNSAMVRSGHALAFRKYSKAFVREENLAKIEKRGLWSGSFDAPWDFRASKWSSASVQTPNGDCPIKGNINRQGEKIYHAPWSNSYERTKINTAKSERWFCSEAEALAAGWRAPRRSHP